MGLMMLPNGNGGMMVIPTPNAPSAPTEYTGTYLTDGDVRVDVTYHTGNKALVDDYEAALMQGTGWRMAPEAPSSPMSNLAAGSIAILVLAIGIPMVAFFGAILLEIADLIAFQTIDLVIKFSIRAMLVAAPIAWLILAAWTLKEHTSRRSHD